MNIVCLDATYNPTMRVSLEIDDGSVPVKPLSSRLLCSKDAPL